MIVQFYQAHFPAETPWASAKTPYRTESSPSPFTGDDYSEEFAHLKAQLSEMGCAVPTLYKQYSELCEPGGVSFADFNIDPDFADCIDGLVRVDITAMKPARYKRYIAGAKATSQQTSQQTSQAA